MDAKALDFPGSRANNLPVPRLVIEHLTKTFPGPGGERVPALEEVSLTVAPQELLVLVGPSGCGKTTLLRLIAGLDEPTRGMISIDGRLMNQVPPQDRDVAMVFQHHALYPHLSAYENLAMGLRLRKLPAAEIEERVREAAALLSLTDCLARKPHALSGGERQRVALGRALVRRPKVLLLDEPLSNLDAPLRVQMRALISRLQVQFGSTMVYVTHDQAEALALGGRLAVLNRGMIQQIGDPLQVYDHPANLFVAGFVGSPAMNFFKGMLVQRNEVPCFQFGTENAPEAPRLRLEAAPPERVRAYLGKPVVLGIRPEHVRATPVSREAPADHTLTACVQEVVRLGQATHIHLLGGAHSFVAWQQESAGLDVGQTLCAAFDMHQAHFFAPETGQAIL